MATSKELREELAAIDLKIADEQRAEAEAVAAAKVLAREGVREGADSKVLNRLRGVESACTAARNGLRRYQDAKAQIEVELQGALAVEEAEALQEDAKAAAEFASGLANTFREVDRYLVEMKSAYAAAVAAVREARQCKWNVPSEELLRAKLVRAMRTAFSLRELGLPPLPPMERTSFTALGEAYAAAITGGAQRSLSEPKSAPVGSAQTVQPVTAASKPIHHADIGMPLPGDREIGFEVREARRR